MQQKHIFKEPFPFNLGNKSDLDAQVNFQRLRFMISRA